MSQHPTRPRGSAGLLPAAAPLARLPLDHATLIACIAAQHPSLRAGAHRMGERDIHPFAPDSLDARIALFAMAGTAPVAASGAFDCDTASLRHDRANDDQAVNLCASGDGKPEDRSRWTARGLPDAARVPSSRTL